MIESLPAESRTVELPTPYGLSGARATLSRMRSLIHEGAASALVIGTARDIVANIPERDYLGELRAVDRWVSSRLRYTRDVAGAETLQTAERMLRDIREKGQGFGDCDCHAVLAGSLLKAIGFPLRLVMVGRTIPPRPHHVLLSANVEGNWHLLDCTQTSLAGHRFTFREDLDV